MKSAQGLLVSVFDDEMVKNEAGGGNLSALERRTGVVWAGGGEAALRVFLHEAGHDEMYAISPPLRQTDRQEGE